MPLPLRSRWPQPARMSGPLAPIAPIARSLVIAQQSGCHDLHVDVLGLQTSEGRASEGLASEVQASEVQTIAGHYRDGEHRGDASHDGCGLSSLRTAPPASASKRAIRLPMPPIFLPQANATDQPYHDLLRRSAERCSNGAQLGLLRDKPSTHELASARGADDLSIDITAR